MNHFKKYGNFLPLFLACFSSLLELVPSDHHHHGEHACIQIDGSFFYLEDKAHDEEIHEHGQSLIGFRLGETHDHHDCALCQRVTAAQTSFAFISWYSNRQIVVPFGENNQALSHGFETKQSRAPPFQT